MPIEAPISELGLFELFQLISLTDKNGILNLNDEETNSTYKLYFRDGCLVYMDVLNRVKDELIKRGLAGEEEIGNKNDNEIFDYILNGQKMTNNTLTVLLKRIIEDELYSLFLIKSGHFSFKEEEFNVHGAINLSMKVENIILEAARRMDEISKMEDVLPSREIVLEVSSDVIGMESINLGRMDWKLLSLINGERTISELIDELGDEFETLKSLYGMILTGIITEKRIEIGDIVKEERTELEEAFDRIRELWNKGRYSEGIEVIHEYKKKFPDNPLLSYELGYFYLADGKFRESISEWDSFLILTDDVKKKNEIARNISMVRDLKEMISKREVTE